jgi:hypothetical protein
LPVKAVESIGGVNQYYCFIIWGVPDIVHCVDGCFTTRFMSSAKLQWSSGISNIFFQN